MANNVQLKDFNDLSFNVATDEISSIHYPINKIAFGALDGGVTLVDTSAPLPVTFPGPVTVDSELTLSDLDTGATSDLKASVGLLLASTAGGVALPGDQTSGLFANVKVMPATDRTTDTIDAVEDVVTVMNNKVASTVLFAAIDCATNGDNTIVAAQSGKKIRVLSYDLVVASAVGARWKSGVNNKSGQKSFAANGGMVKSHPKGVLETNTTEALILNLSSGVQTSGELSYCLI